MEDVEYPDPSSSLALEFSEIERLKAEVLVHSARASNSHTRLLHAFDALDESQRKHAQELRDLEKKYIRLERRYHRQTAALHTCEAEKDDLRESVLELVEKVEQSNDIRSWPFNRLQLTRSAGSPRRIEPNVRHSPTQEHLSYAGAIIERLRQERDEERMEHFLTREALQSRIDALEARLARRETELEYYNTHAAHRSPALGRNRAENIGSTSSEGTQDFVPQVRSDPSLKRVDLNDPLEVMTNEDIIKMLNTTAARNRSLEVEIKTLFKQLHEARSLPLSTEAASPPLQPGHQILVRSPLSRGFESTGARTDTPSGRSDVLSPRPQHDVYELNSHSLFTPTLLPKSTPLSDETDDDHSNTDADIDPDLCTNLPLATPTSGGVSGMVYINSGVGVGDGSSCGSLPDPEILGVHDPNRKSAIMAGLDMELEELTAQIDAFRLERESLTRMVTARREYRETQYASGNRTSSGLDSVRRVNDDPSVRPSLEGGEVDAVEHFGPPLENGDNRDENEDVFTDCKKLEQRLNVVEGDCARLRNELSECRIKAEAREKELLVEIRGLQGRVEELSMRCRTAKGGPTFSSQDEYRGTQSENDVECLIDDDTALLDPTPALIPDTKSKIRDDEEDGGDPYTSSFREPIVDFGTSEPREGQPSSSESNPYTLGLDPPRETEGLNLNDSELEGLLDVIDGEVSMMLETPIIPSSLLDRDSSDESIMGGRHDGNLFDYDIDRDRREEEDMEFEGMSDDGSGKFGYEFTVGGAVGVGQRDSHSRTISDDVPSMNYCSSSRETSIDDGDGDDRSGHGDDIDPVEYQLPRDHDDQQVDHEEWH